MSRKTSHLLGLRNRKKVVLACDTIALHTIRVIVTRQQVLAFTQQYTHTNRCTGSKTWATGRTEHWPTAFTFIMDIERSLSSWFLLAVSLTFFFCSFLSNVTFYSFWSNSLCHLSLNVFFSCAELLYSTAIKFNTDICWNEYGLHLEMLHGQFKLFTSSTSFLSICMSPPWHYAT